MPPTKDRWTLIAGAASVAGIQGRISGTYTRARKCWRKSWILSTTSPTTLTACGRYGILFFLGILRIFFQAPVRANRTPQSKSPRKRAGAGMRKFPGFSGGRRQGCLPGYANSKAVAANAGVG